MPADKKNEKHAQCYRFISPASIFDTAPSLLVEAVDYGERGFILNFTVDAPRLIL